MKKGKGVEDAFSELLHHLMGTAGVGVKGWLPYQVWASELSDSSELVKAFEEEWGASDQTRNSHVGAYSTFFASKFHELPDEEQENWIEHVKTEKDVSLRQREELGKKMGQTLPPAEAQA